MPGDPQLRYADVEIECEAPRCYELLCDVAQVPDWVPGVADVRIDQFDSRGRALIAQFVGMPGRGSFAYSVTYAYDDETMTVQWSSSDRSQRDMDGEATVTALAGGRCSVRYGSRSWSTPAAPSWASDKLDDEAPTPVVESFRRWVAAQSKR